jgi:peptidoglycan/LPS O-acetylase OafA/YrhL
LKYNPALDGLRAVAVLAVVAYHAGLPVPAGFAGVDVFFVISGFLITRLLHDELQGSGRIDFMAFYARRARRILPALVVVMIAALGLTFLLLRPSSLAAAAKSAAAASAFVANFFFQARTGGYWSEDAARMPLLHLWSLSVEEQFYLLWPLVLLASRRRPALALGCIAFASLGLAEWWSWSNPQAAFYQMPSRAWELALGGLVALQPVKPPRGSAWLGMIVVLAACFVPLGHFPGLGALPVALGTALVIAALQAGQRVAALESRPAVFVGLISYGLYLWHWPLLAIDHAMNNGASSIPVRLAIVALAFGLAVASHRYVETPFRRLRAPSRRTVVAGSVVLAMFACTAFAVGSRPVAFDAAARAATDFPSNRFTCHQQALGPPTPLAEACKNRPGNPDVVMWGDSMALAWQPYAFARRGVVADYSRDACPPFDVGNGTARDRWCEAFDAMVWPRALAADTVILAARWTGYDSIAGLEAVMRKLDRQELVIIGPTPTLPARVPDCIGMHDPDACSVTRASFDAAAAPARTELKRLARKYGATYVEPVDFFCTPETCPAVRDGLPLYWDDKHVSSRAARAFSRL